MQNPPGGLCFAGGLLGPDGTQRYLGKWCKRGQSEGTLAKQGSKSTGNLIAVGADGRGGRIKVLRSSNQYSQVGSRAHLFCSINFVLHVIFESPSVLISLMVHL